MKRKGRNSKKKEKKEINGQFTQKLSRQGFFGNFFGKNFTNFCWSFVVITTSIYKVLEMDK